MSRMFPAACLAVMTACACADARGQDPKELDKVVVTGSRAQGRLEHVSETGSRLGLSVRETPATLEVVSQDDMQRQGMRTQREAYDSVVGAISGNNPGNPAVVTMRGFGNAAISIMQDGVRISSSTMVTRDTNTWHFEKIEVLKGPSSVLYGEGALAGIINKVTRKPDFEGNHAEALLATGSFATRTTAGGVNLQVSDSLALRFDASNLRSDSLYDINDNRARTSGLTGSMLYRPSAALSVLLAVDHYDDRYHGTYQGMPMIARSVAREPSRALRSSDDMVLDKTIRHNNYNLAGNYSGARDTNVRSRIDYTMGAGWTVANDLSVYRARRDFVYIGAQVYTSPSALFPNGSLARSAQDIRQDHDYWGNRLVFNQQGTIAGLRNRFSAGGEYNQSDFGNPRKFSPVGGIPREPIPNADIVAPVRSAYPSDQVYTTNVVYDTTVKTSSLFVENALNLTPAWLVVGGLRYDRIDLQRSVTDRLAGRHDSSGTVTYEPLSWRLGTTLDITPAFTVYGQYTTAFVPVSTILIQPIETTRFKMTSGRSQEIGFKSALQDGRVALSGALYDIEQDDILTRDPGNPNLVVQGGKQSARGAEFAFDVRISDGWTLNGGVSHVDARYDRLVETGGADRSGNRPINTPSNTADLGVSYRFGRLPVTVSSKARHVSGFYTDTANRYFVRGRTTLDAALSYRISGWASVTLRGRNLTDAFYGEYSGYPVTSVYIGAPRSYELSMAMDF